MKLKVIKLSFCLFVCFSGNTGLRTKIRTGFRIRVWANKQQWQRTSITFCFFIFQGAICGDTCSTCFCPCCTAIQLYNELEFQGLWCQFFLYLINKLIRVRAYDVFMHEWFISTEREREQRKNTQPVNWYELNIRKRVRTCNEGNYVFVIGTG